ncbi:HHIP 2, partial [Paramuricea clavata]
MWWFKNCAMAMFLSLVVFVLTCYSVQSHPQCLDSQPPFKPNAKRMWCKDSFKLGCCTKRDDSKLKALYDTALKTVNAQNKSQCKRYLSKVVCLKCHSWSAHIYDVEANPNYNAKAALPCLGWKFCTNFVTHCAQAIEYIYGAAMKTRNITLGDFCRESEVALNKDLCYPKIKKTVRQLKNSKPDNIARGLNATQKGCLCVREVIHNLRNPLALLHANDQTHRMFIVEQIGLVYVILPNERKLDTPFMDIRSKVLTSSAFGDERGLLGMVFHPKYRENGRLFVYYITKKVGNKKKTDPKEWWLGTSVAVLSEWRVSGADLNRVDQHSEKVLMSIEQPKGNHNGGQLLFGKDKYLYVFPGDGGAAGDPFGKFGNALN